MKVNFFDLTEQYKTIKSDVEKSILEILDTQRFVLGKYVSKIETDLASLCGSKYAVAVSSGTDAILSALMALDIKPEDEIILPDFTFFATAGTIARLNAVPVFVDIDKNTYNISAKEVRKHITKKTKAIIPVHLYGYCANIEELNEISREFNIPIIEDACQAIGSEYKDGRRAGNLGLMGCFSFYPTKNLGGGGDSGAVTTNDEKIYNKLKQMRNHGMEPRYYHSFIGGNFRMDEFQAAILCNKMPHLENWNNKRRENAQLYKKYFQEYNLTEDNSIEFTKNNKVIIPLADQQEYNNLHIYHQYCIRVQKRDELKQFLADNEIGSDIYYPVPLHKQTCFNYLKRCDDDFSVTNAVCNEILALPIYPELKEEHIKFVVETIAKFIKK